jgi:hypothetical protein
MRIIYHMERGCLLLEPRIKRGWLWLSHLVVHIHALNGARKKMKERINDDDEKAYRDVTQRSQKEHPKDQEAPSVTRR